MGDRHGAHRRWRRPDQYRVLTPRRRSLTIVADRFGGRLMNASDLIAALRLSPLPVEGGYFRETWRGEPVPAGAGLGAGRVYGTAIYYLLTDERDCFSAMHRLPTDEVYHFYLGDPVEQLLLYRDGSHETVTLGQQLDAGHRLQSVVGHGTWQGSRLVPGGRFALMGTTMAPGFRPSDYEGGDRADLLRRYPAVAHLIRSLTRS